MAEPRNSIVQEIYEINLLAIWRALQDNDEDEFKRLFDELAGNQRRKLLREKDHGRSLLHCVCGGKAGPGSLALVLSAIQEEFEDEDEKIKYLWAFDENEWTPLHYACQRNNTEFLQQLLNPPWADSPITIPRDVCATLLDTDPDCNTMRELLKHSRGHPQIRYGELFEASVAASCVLPSGMLEDTVPIVVVGEKNAGKSTIIRSLQVEGASSRMYHTLINMGGRDLYKAGIVPTQLTSHSYLGRVVFFELSGNREFVHEAILDRGHLEDAIFIIVINTTEDRNAMTQQIVYWINFIRYSILHNDHYSVPNIAFVGSHGSSFQAAFNRAKALVPEFKFREIIRITMDCRRTSIGVLRLQTALYHELQRLRRHSTSLPSICYVLYSVVLTLCEEKSERAITIGDLLEELSTSSQDHYALLPQDPLEIAGYCNQLHRLNIFYFLKDDEELIKSWIITDPRPLLHEIEVTVFEGIEDKIPAFKQPLKSETNEEPEECVPAPKQATGLVELKQIRKMFQHIDDPITADTSLRVKLMKHFKYCDEVLVSQCRGNQDSLQRNNTHACFYIPHLLPRQLQYDRWKVNEKDYTYLGTWAMVPDNFVYFMPHLIHKLLLRLSLSSITPINCSRSHRCLAWADPTSSAEVLISDHGSEVLVLNMRCFSGHEVKSLELRKKIIEKIRLLMEEIDRNFTTRELFVPRSRVQRRGIELPVTNPLHRKLACCSLKSISEAVHNNEEAVQSLDATKNYELSDLVYFEPYSAVRSMPDNLRTLLTNAEHTKDQVSKEFIQSLIAELGRRTRVNLFLQLMDLPMDAMTDSEEITVTRVFEKLQNQEMTYNELQAILDSVSIATRLTNEIEGTNC